MLVLRSTALLAWATKPPAISIQFVCDPVDDSTCPELPRSPSLSRIPLYNQTLPSKDIGPLPALRAIPSLASFRDIISKTDPEMP